MVAKPAVQPGSRGLDDRIAHPDLGPRISHLYRVTHPLLAGAARGLAIGLLVVALASAAYAAQSLHTGLRIVDWTIGIGQTAVPLLLLFVGLRLAAAGLAWALGALRHRGPAPSRRLAGALIPVFRFIGRPLVASTIGIVLLTWASPTDGPLALYHTLFFFEIPIATGALVGLLVGVAMATGKLGLSPRRERILLAAGLLPALILGTGVGAWVVVPGAGDPIVRETPEALDAIRLLDLADPSQPGPYTVVSASYGSGLDARRAEYGRDVDWVTPTVDASAALGDRGDIDGPYACWFWGFDTAHLPLNALVWYPADSPGRLPVALIVHGNHDAGEYSDPGYTYLAEHLASRGIIAASIDENFLNGDAFFDYSGAEIGARAWLLLRHLEQLGTWDSTPGHPLAGRVDLQRVALIGHSRGGEAAVLAAVLAANPNSVVGGFSSITRGFGIKAVVAFAPSDGMYRGPGSSATLRDIDYLVIQGAHDGDLPGYTGLQTYHRVALSAGGDHLKVEIRGVATIESRRCVSGRCRIRTGGAPLSTAVLTRWPISVEILVLADDVDEHDYPTDDALGRWFATAWYAFLQRCHTLRDIPGNRPTRLSLGPLRLSSRRSVRPRDTVLIALGATELRPSSFVLAFRVRILGSHAAPIVDGHRSVSLVDTASGSRISVPVEIQSELITLAGTASEYC